MYSKSKEFQPKWKGQQPNEVEEGETKNDQTTSKLFQLKEVYRLYDENNDEQRKRINDLLIKLKERLESNSKIDLQSSLLHLLTGKTELILITDTPTNLSVTFDCLSILIDSKDMEKEVFAIKALSSFSQEESHRTLLNKYPSLIRSSIICSISILISYQSKADKIPLDSIVNAMQYVKNILSLEESKRILEQEYFTNDLIHCLSYFISHVTSPLLVLSTLHQIFRSCRFSIEKIAPSLLELIDVVIGCISFTNPCVDSVYFFSLLSCLSKYYAEQLLNHPSAELLLGFLLERSSVTSTNGLPVSNNCHLAVYSILYLSKKPEGAAQIISLKEDVVPSFLKDFCRLESESSQKKNIITLNSLIGSLFNFCTIDISIIAHCIDFIPFVRACIKCLKRVTKFEDQDSKSITTNIYSLWTRLIREKEILEKINENDIFIDLFAELLSLYGRKYKYLSSEEFYFSVSIQKLCEVSKSRNMVLDQIIRLLDDRVGNQQIISTIVSNDVIRKSVFLNENFVNRFYNLLTRKDTDQTTEKIHQCILDAFLTHSEGVSPYFEIFEKEVEEQTMQEIVEALLWLNLVDPRINSKKVSFFEEIVDKILKSKNKNEKKNQKNSNMVTKKVSNGLNEALENVCLKLKSQKNDMLTTSEYFSLKDIELFESYNNSTFSMIFLSMFTKGLLTSHIPLTDCISSIMSTLESTHSQGLRDHQTLLLCSILEICGGKLERSKNSKSILSRCINYLQNVKTQNYNVDRYVKGVLRLQQDKWIETENKKIDLSERKIARTPFENICINPKCLSFMSLIEELTKYDDFANYLTKDKKTKETFSKIYEAMSNSFPTKHEIEFFYQFSLIISNLKLRSSIVPIQETSSDMIESLFKNSQILNPSARKYSFLLIILLSKEGNLTIESRTKKEIKLKKSHLHFKILSEMSTNKLLKEGPIEIVDMINLISEEEITNQTFTRSLIHSFLTLISSCNLMDHDTLKLKNLTYLLIGDTLKNEEKEEEKEEEIVTKIKIIEKYVNDIERVADVFEFLLSIQDPKLETNEFFDKIIRRSLSLITSKTITLIEENEQRVQQLLKTVSGIDLMVSISSLGDPITEKSFTLFKSCCKLFPFIYEILLQTLISVISYSSLEDIYHKKTLLKVMNNCWNFQDRINAIAYQAKPYRELNKLIGDQYIEIDLDSLYESSFGMMTSDLIKTIRVDHPLRIKYKNSKVGQFQGQDDGGICRDWFYKLSHEIANPIHGILSSVSENFKGKYFLSQNVNEIKNEDFTMKVLGRLIGISVVLDIPLAIDFVPSFFKILTGEDISFEDLEMVDQSVFGSLKTLEALRKNKSEDFDKSVDGMKFSIFDSTLKKDIELKNGGMEENVTGDNFDEFKSLVIKNILVDRCLNKMKLISEGINDVIPLSYLFLLDHNELRNLICTELKLDVKSWKDRTEYDGYSNQSDVIIWFWEEVEKSYKEEDQVKLFQWMTGSPRFPFYGFKGRPNPTIKKSITSVSHLPSTSTCLCCLFLPEYPDKETLSKKLRQAMQETSFGLC